MDEKKKWNMIENLVEKEDRDLSHQERTRKLMLKIGTETESYVFKIFKEKVMLTWWVDLADFNDKRHSAQMHSYWCDGQCDISDKLLLFYLKSFTKKLPTLCQKAEKLDQATILPKMPFSQTWLANSWSSMLHKKC